MKAVYKSMKRAVGIKSRKPPKDGDDDVAAVASEEAGLWSSPDEDAKQAFQRDKWLPFFREVDGAVKATRKRYEEGVGFEAVLPPQADWAAWTTKCRALTLETPVPEQAEAQRGQEEQEPEEQEGPLAQGLARQSPHR